jgi:GDPmannose 4,6-dehydratase
MTSRSALITGITGMDGRLLADLLLSKGYSVFGLYRKNPNKTFLPIEGITYIESDLSNLPPLNELFHGHHFDEIYNLGAQTFINPSWEDPEYTMNVNCLSVIKFLNYIKDHSPETKFFSASSSEIFSGTSESPQDESTSYSPISPYGTSKVFANNIIKNYREKYNIFACSGILYTHEDVTRDDYYVSKKIAKGVAEIHLGLSDNIVLGDIDASRDWLSAKDVVRAIWMVLQQKSPADFIVSSGVSRTIKDFISSSFDVVKISNWEKYISVDQDLIRSKQKVKITGDNSNLISTGWIPEISFEQMVGELVLNEIKKLTESENEKNILSNS